MNEVTGYIAGLDEPARSTVRQFFDRAAELVPHAEEGRSYGMAALRYRGRGLVSVVATKNGYSLFPFSAEVVARAIDDLSGFDSTKGGIRFTEAAPIPMDVFDRIVQGRRSEIDAALG
ncbi:iron chaperone [Glaciibacter sp. 2TAF33]|uniref:iron chaperone n=1 Tax=Glaciibacter sp. 2TAF33 TaxID=3233015 RepID=UPI003F8F445A